MRCPYCGSELNEGKCPNCSKILVNFKINIACLKRATKKTELSSSWSGPTTHTVIHNYPCFEFIFDKKTPKVLKLTCPLCGQDFQICSTKARWLTKNEAESNNKGFLNKIFKKAPREVELDKARIADKTENHYFINEINGYGSNYIYDENNKIRATIDPTSGRPVDVGLLTMGIGTAIEGAWYLSSEQDDK